MSARLKSNSSEGPEPFDGIEVRHATVADAADIWQLVDDCDVLDTNSCYAYLLLCRDFAATSLVAVGGGQLLGFVTGYIPPAHPDVVFVWQVGTSPAARRKGLGRALLRALLRTPACRGVRFLEATVTPSNTASLRLFNSIADELNTGCEVLPGFAAADFTPGEEASAFDTHEPENRVRIGPFEEHL